MVERDEEMNRMREHVFGEIDKDMDGLVSFDEFIAATKLEDFNKEEEWEVGWFSFVIFERTVVLDL